MKLYNILDRVMNEANFSYLNGLLSKGTGSSGGKKFDLFAAENARQAAIERKIEAAKKAGDTKKVEELEKKLDSSDIGKDDAKEKNRNSDNVQKIKQINELKGKIYFELVEFCNLLGGVGNDGDNPNKVGNAVQVSRGKGTSGMPDKKIITTKYNALKSQIEQLIKYEHGHEDANGKHVFGAPNRYFDSKQAAGKELLKALEKIDINDINFDKQEVPFTTDAAKAKTGALTGKTYKDENGDSVPEKYAKVNGVRFRPDLGQYLRNKLANAIKFRRAVDIETKAKTFKDTVTEVKLEKLITAKHGEVAFKDLVSVGGFNVANWKTGEMTTRVQKTKTAKIEGAKRFNPEAYTTLKPFIQEFRKYRADYNDVKYPDPVQDQVSHKVKENLEGRYKKASDALNKSSKELKKVRQSESEINKITTAKDTSKGEDGKLDHKEYNGQRNAGKMALRQTYATDGKTANQGFLEAKKIEKLNITKFRKVVKAWIDSKATKDDKHVIKFYGVMPGGDSGAGNLIFMPTDKPVEGQFSYEGLYAFKVSKQFISQLSNEESAYVESHAGRKTDAWKQAVKKALGVSSMMTEEIIFNY